MPRKARDLDVHFDAHVLVSGPNECWLWTGLTHHGYGAFSGQRAHRFAYERANGPIPKDGPGYHGWVVCHRCDVPLCCNPAHLWLGSARDNTLDRTQKGRTVAWCSLKTHCKNGHPFDAANTYVLPGTGYRVCRSCRQATLVKIGRIKAPVCATAA